MVLYGLLDEHKILRATFEIVVIYIYKLIFFIILLPNLRGFLFATMVALTVSTP